MFICYYCICIRFRRVTQRWFGLRLLRDGFESDSWVINVRTFCNIAQFSNNYCCCSLSISLNIKLWNSFHTQMEVKVHLIWVFIYLGRGSLNYVDGRRISRTSYRSIGCGKCRKDCVPLSYVSLSLQKSQNRLSRYRHRPRFCTGENFTFNFPTQSIPAPVNSSGSEFVF